MKTPLNILKITILTFVFPLFAFASTNTGFSVASWIPYWSQDLGIPTLQANLSKFDIITPFAYEVDSKAHLVDKLKISKNIWATTFDQARNKNIKIVPSILWTAKKQMHNVFSDTTLRINHENEVVDMVTNNNFDGVEIDYEGKNDADKDIFSTFITELSNKLHSKNKILVCTVEARMYDTAPASVPANKKFPWANDWSVMNNYCDQVRIMAYDEYSAVFQSNKFKTTIPLYNSVSNASIDYVTKISAYAVTRIDPKKIILGIPSYGYDFTYSTKGKTRSVQRFGAKSYLRAVAVADYYKAVIKDTGGGEKYFTYTAKGKNHYVVFADANTINARFALAKKLGLGGAALFKIDGLEDPKMWNSLELAIK
ncbi:MAG: glycosyl hydrolase family 18 protein [Candidatus Paceibacterota bacterium]